MLIIYINVFLFRHAVISNSSNRFFASYMTNWGSYLGIVNLYTMNLIKSKAMGIAMRMWISSQRSDQYYTV